LLISRAPPTNPRGNNKTDRPTDSLFVARRRVYGSDENNTTKMFGVFVEYSALNDAAINTAWFILT